MHANPDGYTPEALDKAAVALERAAANYEAAGDPKSLYAAKAAREEAKAKRDSAVYQRQMQGVGA